MTTYKEQKKANALANKFKGRDIDITKDEIREKLEFQIEKFNLGVEQGAKMVEQRLIERAGENLCHLESSGSKCKERLLDDFTEENKWGDITVIVESVWEETGDSVQCAGIIADQSGRKKFTIFDKANKQDLEEGERYNITDVISKEFNGNIELKITKESEIHKYSGFKPDEHNKYRFEGQIIDLGKKSGVIKKCAIDNCGNFIDPSTHECREHGEVWEETNTVVQLVAKIDNGSECKRFHFTEEDTLDILEKEKEEIINSGREKSIELLEENVQGEYIHLTAKQSHNDRISTVFNYNFNPEVDKGRINTLLAKAREMKTRFN